MEISGKTMDRVPASLRKIVLRGTVWSYRGSLAQTEKMKEMRRNEAGLPG